MQESAARQMLEAERGRLLASREGMSEELNNAQQEGSAHSGVLSPPADQAPRLQAREEDESLIAHLDGALREVEAALKRLDAGTYGRCEVDGEPIPDERLEALPATRYCLAHEQEQEQLSAAERNSDQV